MNSNHVPNNKDKSYGTSNGTGSPTTASEAFGIILERIGDCGKWQFILTLITGFCGCFTALHNVGAVFLAATPDHWCDVPYINENSTYEKSVFNFTSPWVKSKTGVLEPSRCQYLNYSVTEPIVKETKQNPWMECNAWYYDKSDFSSTVVTEYNLVCGKRWLMSSIQSTYMLGILAGAVVFSILSDKWGRRKISLLCVVIFFISSVIVAFTRSFTSFLTFRFLVAASGQGMFLINYILLMETVGAKGRNLFGNLFHLGFSIGFTFLSLFAYLFRDWRNLQLCTSIPTILLASYYWILPESPRWLLVNGKYDEGIAVLEQIAKTNKKKMPNTDELNNLMNVIRKEVMTRELAHETIKEKIEVMFRNVLSLVRTKNMRRRSLITFYGWFVVSMVYYGLTFNSSNINASLFLNIFISGILEIPATFLAMLVLHWFGRRPILSLSLSLSGIATIAIAFIPSELVWVNIFLSNAGKFMIGIGFMLVFMFSAELVPTHVRNVSIGMASMFGRIGSSLSPFVVDLLGDVYYSIPSTVFGVCTLLAGILSLLLPETRKKRLPESIEEIEKLSR